MASYGSTWRKHCFQKGHNYVVIQNIDKSISISSEFKTDEVYQYLTVNYSHYDGCSFFEFCGVENQKSYTWCWYDDDLAEPDKLFVKMLS